MQIFSPPSVSGWPAFYQEPVYDLFWLNSVTIKARKNLTDSSSQWGIWLDDNINLRYSLSDFIETFQNIESLDLFINELADRFLGGEIPEQALIRIKNTVLGDSFNENHWNEEISDFKLSPTREKHNSLQNKISSFMHLIFQLNEIHVH